MANAVSDHKHFVVGHMASKCCLFVLDQHLGRQPALLPDLPNVVLLLVLLDN